MKILLAIDGSRYTQRMLAFLAAHPLLLGVSHTYTAFTAVTSIPSYASKFVDTQTVLDSYRDEAMQVLAPVQVFADQQGWNLTLQHAPGYAPDAIAQFANAHKPDLLVMGTHGHSALSNLVMGSAVNGVLARCTVPVLLIR
jgi:nucleotide-binding universal stress UspA family protein